MKKNRNKRFFTWANLLTIWIAMGWNSSVYSQYDGLRVNIRVTENSRIDPKADAYIEQILKSCQRVLGNYNSRATLMDIDQGGVTSESIEQMKTIFFSNPRVFDDLVEYGNSIPLDDYIGKIRKYMNNSGPDYRITDLLLLDVKTNPAIPGLYFEISIRANKLMLNRIDDKRGTVFTIPKGGELIPLQFEIIVQGNELSDVKIYEIKGTPKPRPKSFNQELAFFSSMAMNVKTAYTVHAGFGESGFSPDLKSNYLFDIGMKYSRSFGRGKHSKWLIGAAYGLHSWNANTQNSRAIFEILREQVGALEFNTQFELQNVDNVINFSYIQGMLGFQMPLKRIAGYKTEYWIEAAFLPTYVSKKEKIGENDELVRNSVVRFGVLEEQYCNNQEAFLSIESQEKLNNKYNILTNGVMIKPYIRHYLDRSKKTGLTAGISYVHYFGSWIDTNTISAINPSTTDEPHSLLFQSFTPSLLRLEVGLSFKL
jgi:hypothetical protein